MTKQIYAKYVNKAVKQCYTYNIDDYKKLTLDSFYKVSSIEVSQSVTYFRLYRYPTSIFNSIWFDFYIMEDGLYKSYDIMKDKSINPFCKCRG